MVAFAAGITAGSTTGLSKKPHEFAILGGEPSAWDVSDVLALLKLQSFLLPSNWDVEVARLRILLADGPDALRRSTRPARSSMPRTRKLSRTSPLHDAPFTRSRFDSPPTSPRSRPIFRAAADRTTGSSPAAARSRASRSSPATRTSPPPRRRRGISCTSARPSGKRPARYLPARPASRSGTTASAPGASPPA